MMQTEELANNPLVLIVVGALLLLVLAAILMPVLRKTKLFKKLAEEGC